MCRFAKPRPSQKDAEVRSLHLPPNFMLKTDEPIDDELYPVQLGEDELMQVPYQADDPSKLKHPFTWVREETEQDRLVTHRCDLGGAWIGPVVLYTDCGLAGKPWLKIITKSYGRESATLARTGEPGFVNCPLCIAKATNPLRS